MSKCISSHGEYSSHETDERYVCKWCGAFDEAVVLKRLEAVEAERDAALARIAEAAKLHRPRKHWNSDREYMFVCDECTRINRYGIARWPCPTAVSLGLNEGEHDES